MRKTYISVLAAVLLTGALIVPAAAEGQHPAVNRDACAEAGGTFTGTQTGVPYHTCVVESGQDSIEIVTASHPRQAWKAVMTIPGGTDVYTFRPSQDSGNPFGHEVIGGGEPYQSGCLNHQGKPITDWETNSNCVPA
jgi:hypothetical protein